MSNREIALEIVRELPDEKINAFLALFASDTVKALIETETIAADPDRKHYSSFDEIAKEILEDE